MRRLLQALLAAAATGAFAGGGDGPQVWLNPGMYSHHFRQGDYRQDNYGIGAEVIVAPEHGLIAGNFINSNRERSRYAGYHWRPWQWQPADIELRTGLILALIDGYSNTNHGDWFPVAFPTLSAEYRMFGANLIFIPASKNGAVLALQLKLRVW
jgi:antimicrobial peptide resistance and lipid A acylation protein PagP